jgi:alpha-1,3-rhamnosyltransferase
MNNPLVSIIVSSYNHERYIQQCITSIIQQSYTKIQLIAIDDGSKDDTPVILEQLAIIYGFTFEKQKNIGLPRTLNKAIQNYIQGKYLCILASDDFLPKDSIEKRVAFMEKNPDYAVGYGRSIIINKNSEIIGYDDTKHYRSGEIFGDLFLAKYWLPAPTAIIKREVFNEVGYYDENLIFEDYYMWLKISYKFPIGFIDDYLVCYRIHDMNFHHGNEVLLEQQKVILDAYSEHPLYNNAIKSWHFRNFLFYCQTNRKRAFKHMICSLKYIYNKDYIRALYKFLKHKNYA